MSSYIFESLGMLIIPLIVFVGAAPTAGVPVSKKSLLLPTLVFAWPLATIGNLYLSNYSQVVFLSAFAAAGLGVTAAIICIQALPIKRDRATQKNMQEVRQPIVDSIPVWGNVWRLLVLWFSISIILIAFTEIYLLKSAGVEWLIVFSHYCPVKRASPSRFASIGAV